MDTSDVVNATTIRSSSSISQLSGLNFGSVTVGTVSLVVELEEMGINLQSPHHNAIILTAGIENGGSVTNNTALVTAQQTSGGANVTISVNTVVVGGGGLAATTVPSVAATNDPTVLLSLLANPAFSVLSSFPVAQMLLIREAFRTHAATSASQTRATALDVINVGVSQFAPHHNAVHAATAVNTVAVSSNGGFVTAQQQAGFANVQASVNTIIAASGSVSSTGISF
jgi:hypothetical protein